MPINANRMFEIIADLYEKRTGYLRPGKDASPMSGQRPNSDENMGRFLEWRQTHAMEDAAERIAQLEDRLQTAEAYLEGMCDGLDFMPDKVAEFLKGPNRVFT